MPAEPDLFKRSRGMHTCVKPSACWDGEPMVGDSHAEPRCPTHCGSGSLTLGLGWFSEGSVGLQETEAWWSGDVHSFRPWGSWSWT